MTASLHDPGELPAPTASDTLAHSYITLLHRLGVSRAMPNVRTTLFGLKLGDQLLPVTVNDGERGGSYVCLPHSAYSLYARREIALTTTGVAAWAMQRLIDLAEPLLRVADINRIVHIDNWLLSTNLHGDWQGDGLAAARHLLTQHFPAHIISIRSLDAWANAALLNATLADGWLLLPSRQIWVTDDMQAQWTRRRDVGHDRRLLRNSGLEIEELGTMSASDAQRIAQLYAALYLDKYSALNPAFSAEYIAATGADGIMRYHVARAGDGTIMAVAGTLTRGEVLTTPIVGYDTAAPVERGLYRIACLLAGDEALHDGRRMNGSAGAASFKRNRGATGVIEYSAVYVAHLPRARRWPIATIAAILQRFAVPYMRKHQL